MLARYTETVKGMFTTPEIHFIHGWGDHGSGELRAPSEGFSDENSSAGVIQHTNTKLYFVRSSRTKSTIQTALLISALHQMRTPKSWSPPAHRPSPAVAWGSGDAWVHARGPAGSPQGLDLSETGFQLPPAWLEMPEQKLFESPSRSAGHRAWEGNGRGLEGANDTLTCLRAAIQETAIRGRHDWQRYHKDRASRATPRSSILVTRSPERRMAPPLPTPETRHPHLVPLRHAAAVARFFFNSKQTSELPVHPYRAR